MKKEEISKKEKLKESLLRLIYKFREEYKKLDELEKKHIHNSIDYCYPCQIEVFWLSEPLEYQFVVITHTIDRKDMEIILNGPYEGYEFLEKVEQIMQEDRWKKPIPEDPYYYIKAEFGTTKYSDVFTSIMSNYLKSIQYRLFSKIGKAYQGGMHFPTGWFSYVAGNILEIDYYKILEKSISEAKSRAKTIREKPQEVHPKTREVTDLLGYGTYYYPPIWVNKIPERTIRQMISDYFPPSAKIFDTSLNEIKIIVDSDGFIGIVNGDKQQAIRILNIIFGFSYISGINCIAANESEIAKIEIDPKSLEIHSKLMKSSSLRTQRWDLVVPFGQSAINYYYREIINEEVIKDSIKKSEKIIKHDDIAHQLIFLLAGYTHHVSSEYSQSFIINWIILEKYLLTLWKNLLEEKTITGKRKNKLTDTMLWGTDYILETLNISGNLEKENYDLIIYLKKKRNDFVHRGKLIAKSDSERLLNICKDIVKNNLYKIIKVGNISKRHKLINN